MKISTHVLDTDRGLPSAGIPVTLEIRAGRDWRLIGSAQTNADGRVPGITIADLGTYRLTFDLTRLAALVVGDRPPFFPEAVVVFSVSEERDYHLPLLRAGHQLTFYRGS